MQAQFETSREEELRLAARAKDLLTDPILDNAFRVIREDIVRDWRMSKDPIEREALHQRLFLVDELRTKLEILVQNGDKAQHDLNAAARREKFGENA